MSPRVLIADGDVAVHELVGGALRAECFEVQAVRDGPSALAEAIRDGYDVVLLELELPRLAGTEVLRRLRAVNPVPIIVVSARDSEVDRVLGLELGADDYVTKPFSVPELMSRIRALLRRCELERAGRNGIVRHVGGVEIDLELRHVLVDGRLVYLTGSQFNLLALLSEEPGRVVPRREILRRLWESEHVGDEHVCEVHISNLRHKIERDPTNPKRIVTVRGIGYKLVVA